MITFTVAIANCEDLAAARSHIRRLQSDGHTAMIHPYPSGIETGEISQRSRRFFLPNSARTVLNGWRSVSREPLISRDDVLIRRRPA
jgi:hypothetical protein